MPRRRLSKTVHERTLGRDEVQQRVIRVDASWFPPADTLFDVWHEGLPWGARIRSEPCACGRPQAPHRHAYIEGGELHAGLDWRVGATLRFVKRDERIEVDGDLSS